MEIVLHILIAIGTIVLLLLTVIGITTAIAFFILRKKYYHYRDLWKGKKNFFSVVIFPFIEWVAGVVDYSDRGGEYTKPLYRYTTKKFFLTRPEHDCFNALVQAVGYKYYVLPQVNLDKFLDEHTKGQKWVAALRHINQKSVDFLLCDKIYLNPELAIELDDSTHDREDRRARDTEVERILNDAHFPLLRIHYSDLSSSESLKQKILAAF